VRRISALLRGVVLAAAVRPAAAEPFHLPSFLSLGGEASFSYAHDDEGYFNFTDYQNDILRLAHLDLSAELRAGRHLALLLEASSDNLDTLRFYALYVRFRPFAERSFDVQLGRIPTVFGSFARRAYGYDNPLVGWPLAYQYLTTLRADAVPANADALLAVRGRGWSVPYVGSDYANGPGLPLVSASQWDTGVEVRVGTEPVELAAAVTQGTLCDPQAKDDNGGKQVSARLALKPAVGLVLGVSGARGPYLSSEVVNGLPPLEARNYYQQALGFDAEYSRGHLLLRGEAIVSWWDVPFVEPPPVPSPLRAVGLYLEGRYRIAPGWNVAARVDHLGFNQISGTTRSDTWDANVTRIEAGGSWSPWRHASLKAVYQYNWRDTKRLGREGFVAGQLTLWF
jgi:hypothetical protein